MISSKAIVSRKAKIGKDVRIWDFSKIREGVKIGDGTIIGRNVYVDHNVEIGKRVKIQNNSLIYNGVKIEDEVFVGPAVVLTNDKYPRATNPDGSLKTAEDWQVFPTVIHKGASIGAGSIILPGVAIGYFSMIGAGSVVTKSVGNFCLVLGNPAKLIGQVCVQGHIKKSRSIKLSNHNSFFCGVCNKKYGIDYK